MELILTDELLEHIGCEYEKARKYAERDGWLHDMIPFNQFLEEELSFIKHQLKEGDILVKN